MRPILSLLTVAPVALLTMLFGSLARADSDGDVRRYRVTEIVPPHNALCLAGYQRVTFARRLNDRSQVVGGSVCQRATSDPQMPIIPDINRAILWQPNTAAQYLPSMDPEFDFSEARDINRRGDIVGTENDSLGHLRAPLWPRGGGVADAVIPELCNNLTPRVLILGHAINDAGSVAARQVVPNSDGSCTLPFRWVLQRPSGEKIIGTFSGPLMSAMNNSEVVVGGSGNAIAWSPETGLRTLLAGTASPRTSAFARGINDDNLIVGYLDRSVVGSTCVSAAEAHLWKPDGSDQVLAGLVGAEQNRAEAINRRGVIVGSAMIGQPCANSVVDFAKQRAIVWDRRGRVRDLNTLIPQHWASEVQLVQASAINDRGQILARGIRPHVPKDSCPEYNVDPVTGEVVFDPTPKCYSLYAFLLTPVDD